MQDKITKEKINEYRKITEKALSMAEKSVTKGKEGQAREIIKMVSCYLEDAGHFEEQGHYVNAFACLNYAHGWLDTGARLKIFNVKDNGLFSV